MATIRDKVFFNYDGVDSRDFGLLAVNMDSGLYEETLVPTRDIQETKPEKRDIPIFHGIKLEKRMFSLTIAFEERFNNDMLEGIIEWLYGNKYKPLFFEGSPDRIVFAMITGESSLIHNGMNEGYFTINVETNSPYKYSREKNIFLNGGDVLNINNRGYGITYPKYEIEKIGAGDLELNMNGRSVLIAKLEDKEKIEIDSLRETIKTNIPGVYRYNNIKAGELDDLYFDKGLSEMLVTGEARIKASYREFYMF